MNKKTLGIIGLVVLAIIAGIFIYRDIRSPKDTTKGSISGIDTTGDSNVKVLQFSSTQLPPTPSLVRPRDFDATLAPEVKTILVARLEKAIAAINKDPKHTENWIELGLQRKALGDYEGAREAWEYAKAIEPNNIVPWNNLGDLYHFYLKDYKLSELNWKKTIVLKTDYTPGYRGLYELYRYSLTSKAGEIPALLKAGIAASPEATDLKALLADYQNSIAK